MLQWLYMYVFISKSVTWTGQHSLSCMLLQVYIKKSTFHKKIELQGFITTKEIPMSCTQPHVYCVCKWSNSSIAIICTANLLSLNLELLIHFLTYTFYFSVYVYGLVIWGWHVLLATCRCSCVFLLMLCNIFQAWISTNRPSAYDVIISWRPPLGVNRFTRKRSCQICASRRSQARTKQWLVPPTRWCDDVNA